MSGSFAAMREHLQKGDSLLSDLLYCATAGLPLRVLHEGAAVKRGSVLQNWKERYLILLAPGCLFYAESAAASKAFLDAVAQIPKDGSPPAVRRLLEDAAKLLKGSCRVTKDGGVASAPVFGERSHVVSLKAPNPSERVYYFSFPTAAAAAVWKSLLEDRQADLGGPGVRLPRTSFGDAAPAASPSPTGSAGRPVLLARQQVPAHAPASIDSLWVFGPTDPIQDHFTLGKQLGQPGQFGRAVEAVRRTPGPEGGAPVGVPVAVKIVSKVRFQASGSRAMVEQAYAGLRREVSVMKNFRHPRVLPCYEVFEDRSSLYIVMELCSGGELFDALTRRGRFSERDAAQIMRQVVEGVAYLHSQRVAHCDLKPDNLMFDKPGPDGQIRLIDFGMSKMVRTREYFTRFCGTPYYVAPEVLAGRYDEACDMWSIGVILFVLLCGFPPFHAPANKTGPAGDQHIYSRIRRGFDPTVRRNYGAFFPESVPLSEAARDLIARLLVTDTRARMTASEALEHRWLLGQAPDDTCSAAVIHSLREFSAAGRFASAIVSLMTSSLTPAEVVELQQTFLTLDSNGDGVLSVEEIRQGLRRFAEGLPDATLAEEARRITRLADTDGDGVLSLGELRAVYTQKRLSAREERIWDSFCHLDLDHDGRVTLEELQVALGKDDEDCRRILEEADTNHDGVIDYPEFLTRWRAANPGVDLEPGFKIGEGAVGDLTDS